MMMSSSMSRCLFFFFSRIERYLRQNSCSSKSLHHVSSFAMIVLRVVPMMMLLNDEIAFLSRW